MKISQGIYKKHIWAVISVLSYGYLFLDVLFQLALACVFFIFLN